MYNKDLLHILLVDTMKRENTIVQLALHVIHSNIECYAQVCKDEDDSPTLTDIQSYGTDPETVEDILRDMISEVTTKVQEIQPFIGEIVFNFYQDQQK